MGTTVVAARIDDAVKEQVDKILKAAQLTPTQLVRHVYDYIVVTGDVPEFVKTGECDITMPGRTREQEALRAFMDKTDEILLSAAPHAMADLNAVLTTKQELALLLEQKHLYGHRMGVDYDDLRDVYHLDDGGFSRHPSEDGPREAVPAVLSPNQGEAR